ncbi:transcriptional protein Swt1p [[Candida] anglica]|uniref:Transcriptional protein Swt1p n=1 Tax=[Candida] anglica TaxID=148631 RepID=A0ABP0EAE2_9ASCO
MSLPSKYAPEGLSSHQQRQTLTVGTSRPPKPISYTVRRIENRIESALQRSQTDNEDVEMVGMADSSEIEVITHYVREQRSDTRFQEDQMAVDMSEYFADTLNAAVHSEASAYLVVDTNFILSHLDIISELARLAHKYKFRLIIPITVVQELDGLKKSSRMETPAYGAISGRSISHLARWANDWIYTQLAQNSKSVRGQAKAERLDINTIQDDSILDCCLYFQKLHNRSLVILMSNDKNFCAKAMTNSVLTVSYRPNMTAELISLMVYKEMTERFPPTDDMPTNHPSFQPHSCDQQNIPPQRIDVGSQQYSTAPQFQHQNVSISPTKIPIERGPVSSNSFHEIASTIFREVQAIVTNAIKRCMVIGYGEDIDIIQNYSAEKVTSLHECSHVLVRFKSIVFEKYVGRRWKVDNSFNTTPYDRLEMDRFLNYWLQILQPIYEQEMDSTQQQSLLVLIQRWNNLIQ